MTNSSTQANDASTGAEALLGLSRSSAIAPQKFPSISMPPSNRGGPEPPPLQLPTQQVSHQPPTLLPTAPSLSIPHVPAGVTPVVPLPPPNSLAQHPFPSHQRHDLPSVASFGQWAPPATSFRPSPRSLGGPGLERLPSRISALPAPAIPTAPTPLPAWDQAIPHPVTSLPTVGTEYSLPNQSTHWPAPQPQVYGLMPQISHSQQSPVVTSMSYYLQAYTPAQHNIQQHVVSSQPANTPAVIQQPQFPVAALREHDTGHIPPRLHLPIQTPSREPVTPMPTEITTVAEVPSTAHNHLPSMSMPDDNVFAAQNQPAAQNLNSQPIAITNVITETANETLREVQNQIAINGEQSQNAKDMKKRTSIPKRRRGIADLMNPTDTLPGETDGSSLLLQAANSAGAPPVVSLVRDQLKVMQPVNYASVESKARPKKEDRVAPLAVDTKSDAPKTPPKERDKRSEVKNESSKVEANTQVKKMEEHPQKKVHEGVLKNNSNATDEEIGLRGIDPLAPKRGATENYDREDKEASDGDGDAMEVTRCPCGSADNEGFMIACDTCNTWQHGRCMGYPSKLKVPHDYYCSICRPEEIVYGSIAYRKYKEYLIASGKDWKRQPEILLLSVKPLELRRYFAADLRAERKGEKIPRGELFKRYASLLRNQYSKQRQNIVEGLVIILEMSRADVTDRLDSVLKRMKGSSIDKKREDSLTRRKSGADLSVEVSVNEASGVKSGGSGRNSHKRSRPHSLVYDHGEKGMTNVDAGISSDSMMDIDMDSGRGMSREDRKLQQAMKLFAQMEEREREKKRPRTNDYSISPRAGHSGRAKSSKQQVNSPSPIRKGSVNGKSSGKDANIEADVSSVAKVDDKRIQMSPRGHGKHLISEKQEARAHSPSVHKQARKGGVASLPESDGLREVPKREKEHKSRDKSEKSSGRRKDGHVVDAGANGSSSRRRPILEKGRRNDSKKRRGGSVHKDTDKRLSEEKADSKRDPSLDFKMYSHGSVLGSKLIPMERRSSLDREHLLKEAVIEARRKEALASRLNKKEWIVSEAELCAKANQWRKHSPMKKRFRAPTPDIRQAKDNRDEEKAKVLQSAPSNQKGPIVTFSMVVVSEKQKLPDKGQKLESSRLVLHGVRKEEETKLLDSSPAKNMCLKKRLSMRGDRANGTSAFEMKKATESLDAKPRPETDAAVKTNVISLSPTIPSSPQIASGVMRPAKSPGLRSSPVLTGLRSVSPTLGKATGFSSPLSSPRALTGTECSKATSISGREEQSPSPKMNAGKELKNDESDHIKPMRDVSKEANPTCLQETKRISPTSPLQSGVAGKSIPIRSVPVSEVTSSPQHAETENGGPSRIPNSLPTWGGIRSVPAPAEQSSPRVHLTSQRAEQLKTSPKAQASPVKSPLAKRPDEEFMSNAEVSDIFQQRLRGFLQPKRSNGVHGSTDATNSTSPRLSSHVSSGANSSGTLRSGNRLNGVGKPSFRSKVVETGNHWRSTVAKRSGSSFPHSAGVPPAGSRPLTPRGHRLNTNDKMRFRSSRADAPIRSEDGGRSGSSSSLSQYMSRNSWVNGATYAQKSDGGGKTGGNDHN